MFEDTRKRPRSVSLTPLIDVVFLLLIFFMLATNFAQDQQLILKTPDNSSLVSKSDTPQVIEVRLLVGGDFELNGQPINRDLLALEVKKQATGRDDVNYVIVAEPRAPMQSLVTATEAARLAGIEAVAMKNAK